MLQYFNRKRDRKRGQSTLEYAVLIVVIIGALISIQVYMKRGIQGRLKSASDDIGDQYSDGNMNVLTTTVRNSTSEETFNAGNSATILTGAGELTNTTTNAMIINTQQEYWGTATQ